MHLVIIKTYWTAGEILAGELHKAISMLPCDSVDMVPQQTANVYRFYNRPIELMDLRKFVRDKDYDGYAVFFNPN